MAEHRSQTQEIAVAGCGRILERGYLPALRTRPELRLVALCDPDSARLAAAAESAEGSLGAAPRTYRSAEDLLAAESPAALIVATPTPTHLPLAAAAAGAGVPSLVEKPPAANSREAARLAALDPRPWLGLNRRFLQGAELAASIPTAGWLELDLRLSYPRSGWAAHGAADPALLDVGVHLIDLAAFLTSSRPLAVRNARVTDEETVFELELSRGRARISGGTGGRWREEVEVRDRAGRVVASSRLNRRRALARRLRGRAEPLAGSLSAQLGALATELADEEPPTALATAEAGVAAMRVVAAVERSAALGGAEVTVDLGEADSSLAADGCGVEGAATA